MGRAKAGMEMITNKKARRVTFEKRRKGLEKKAHELSTLCGVRICFIIFGPMDNDMPTEPKIWPENPKEIDSLVDSYKKASHDDRRSRTTDFSFFYKDRTRKAEEDLAKLRKKNLEVKLPIWDDRYGNLSLEEFRQFDSLLMTKLEGMKARVDFMKGTQTYFAETSGSNMLRSSSYDPQENNTTPYMIQNQHLYRSRNNSSPPFEILPQQPISSFDPNRNVLDVPSLNSFNYNSMVNPPMMWWMNNGVSTSTNSGHKSPAQLNIECPSAAAEHISGSLGYNAVGNQVCYYIPTVQQMQLYVQYPLQQSRAPTDVYVSQTDQNCGMSDFQLMHPK